MNTKFYLLITAYLLMSTVSWAQTWPVGSPNAGDVTASLSNGTLTFQGSGQMQHFILNEGGTPWSSHSAEIKTVIIEEGVTNIGQMSFYNHTSLTNVFISSSVTVVGASAFYGCSALTEIIVKNPVPPVSQGMYPFTEVDTRNCVLIVPVGSESAYRAAADIWSQFNIVEEGSVPMLCSPSVSGKFGIEDALTWYVCDNTKANK